MQIVDFFYDLARQHDLIKAFYYGKAYDKGAGNSIYPLVWFDDPLSFRSAGNTIQYTVNIDFLGQPVNDADVMAVQTAAFNVGLSFREKIKKQYGRIDFSVSDFNGLTLRDYYDDNAAGVRFTFNVIQANPVDRCADNFDPAKQFPLTDPLPDFAVDNPTGCAVFGGDVLPNFEI